MRLAQSRFWRISTSRGSEVVEIELLKGTPPGEGDELKPLEIEVPLKRWNLLVKHARTDRRMLGGLALEFARHKDRVSDAIASDVLFVELQQAILDAAAALVEEEILALTVAEEKET